MSLDKPGKTLNSALTGGNLLLDCAFIGIGGYLFVTGFSAVTIDPDEAFLHFGFGGLLIAFGILRTYRLFRPPSTEQRVVAATTRERRHSRAVGILVAAAFVGLGALVIESAAGDPFRLLWGSDFLLIGLIAAVGVWRSRQRAMIERDGAHILEIMVIGRYVYWAVGGILLITATGMMFQIWWFALVFVGFGIGFIAAAIRSSIRQARFGRSMLILSDAPLRLGGRMRGLIETGRGSLDGGTGQPYSARLVVYATTYGSDRRSMRVSTVWSTEADIDPSKVQLTTGGVAIPVDLKISAEAPPSSVRDNINFGWQLEVRRFFHQITYAADFRLYVE